MTQLLTVLDTSFRVRANNSGIRTNSLLDGGASHDPSTPSRRSAMLAAMQ